MQLAIFKKENLMFNTDTLKKLNNLCELYKNRWGKEVDYTALPLTVSQENLLIILERIVDTGESVLVGYDKIFCTNKNDTFQ